MLRTVSTTPPNIEFALQAFTSHSDIPQTSWQRGWWVAKHLTYTLRNAMLFWFHLKIDSGAAFRWRCFLQSDPVQRLGPSESRTTQQCIRSHTQLDKSRPPSVRGLPPGFTLRGCLPSVLSIVPSKNERDKGPHPSVVPQNGLLRSFRVNRGRCRVRHETRDWEKSCSVCPDLRVRDS